MGSTLQPGQVLLGKYSVERVLGQGGMGVVVAARHVDLGQLFAIKCMLPEALAHRDADERFLREARAAATLRSEHVARVIDVGRLPDGLPFMVMEHLEGKDLGALLETRGALPCAEAVTYVLQACEALAEAHALGIVHRDLKPSNLFLTHRPNGTPCVKILDFGISKQVDPGGVQLTRTGTTLGSPLYMSPEHMGRARTVDARTDIWSMGVVLHELLTGDVPFAGETITEVAAHVIQDVPSPPSSIRPGIPRGVDAAVARCLQKRADDRFQTVGELMAALRPHLNASLELSHAATVPVTLGALPRPAVRRRWGLVALAGLGLLGAGAALALRRSPPPPGGAVEATSAVRAEPPPSAAAPPPSAVPTVAPEPEPLPSAAPSAKPAVRPTAKPSAKPSAAPAPPPPASAGKHEGLF